MKSRFDYQRQAWIVDGRYVRCGHPGNSCPCYGRKHEGELAPIVYDSGQELLIAAIVGGKK